MEELSVQFIQPRVNILFDQKPRISLIYGCKRYRNIQRDYLTEK